MQPSGNMPPMRPGTSFKQGPYPQSSGTMGPAVVHVGGMGATVMQTGDADTSKHPAPPKPGPDTGKP